MKKEPARNHLQQDPQVEVLHIREGLHKYPEQQKNIMLLAGAYTHLYPDKGEKLWRSTRIASALTALVGFMGFMVYEYNPVKHSDKVKFENIYQPTAIRAGQLAIDGAVMNGKKLKFKKDKNVTGGVIIDAWVDDGDNMDYEVTASMMLDASGEPDPETTYDAYLQSDKCKTQKCPSPEAKQVELEDSNIDAKLFGLFLDHPIDKMWGGYYDFYLAGNKKPQVSKEGHIPDSRLQGTGNSRDMDKSIQDSSFIARQAGTILNKIEQLENNTQ
jgi:hypothetical protein